MYDHHMVDSSIASPLGDNMKMIRMYGWATAINALEHFLGTPDITTNASYFSIFLLSFCILKWTNFNTSLNIWTP